MKNNNLYFGVQNAHLSTKLQFVGVAQGGENDLQKCLGSLKRINNIA